MQIFWPIVAIVVENLAQTIDGLADGTAEQPKGGWNSFDYPDIRAKPWADQCGSHVPVFGYVCDPSPEPMIDREEATQLNDLLIELAKSTNCNCKRRSQCMTKISEAGPGHVKVGFIVAVAFVDKLSSQLSKQKNPKEAAEKFSKNVRKRWGLGDCGNTALIMIWEERHSIHISTDNELTKFYLTEAEADKIVSDVQDKVKNEEYFLALREVLAAMKVEFDGEPIKLVDVGIVALTASSGVAFTVVAVITACVCAFRCCGNLRNAISKRVIEQADDAYIDELNRISQPIKSIGPNQMLAGDEANLSIGLANLNGKNSVV